MTGAARVYSDLPDRHLVLRRPWWAHDRCTRDTEDDPLADLVHDVADAHPWMREGTCATSQFPDAWFPERGSRNEHTDTALRICGRCPVALACMAYAIEHHPVLGIWGGTTYHERRRALERRREERTP